MIYIIISSSILLPIILKEKKIASSTPIAKGLLGKKVGDVVEIKVPQGMMSFEIIKIEI